MAITFLALGAVTAEKLLTDELPQVLQDAGFTTNVYDWQTVAADHLNLVLIKVLNVDHEESGFHAQFWVQDSRFGSGSSIIEKAIKINMYPTADRDDPSVSLNSVSLIPTIGLFDQSLSSCYLVVDAEYPSIHMILGQGQGVYTHISFGSINKISNYFGGAYVSGGYINPNNTQAYPHEYGAMRIGDQWLGLDESGNINASDIKTNRSLDGTEHLIQASPNTHNNRSILLPINYYRTDSSGYYPLGTVPNAKYVNIKNHVATDELIFGAERWMVFPCLRKGLRQPVNPTTRRHEPNEYIPYSYNYGIAYRVGTV